MDARKIGEGSLRDKVGRFLEGFVNLSDEEWQVLEDLAIIWLVDRKAVLVEEGQPSQKGFFVLHGCLRVSFLKDDEVRVARFLTEGELYVAEGVGTQFRSRYTVTALEDTLLLTATPEVENEAFSRLPKLVDLCAKVAEHFHKKEMLDFDRFKHSSPKERYSYLVQTRPDLVQRVPQHQLASFLGMAPESLSRIRRRLMSS